MGVSRDTVELHETVVDGTCGVTCISHQLAEQYRVTNLPGYR
jgi:hypothetical protein